MSSKSVCLKIKSTSKKKKKKTLWNVIWIINRFNIFVISSLVTLNLRKEKFSEREKRDSLMKEKARLTRKIENRLSNYVCHFHIIVYQFWVINTFDCQTPSGYLFCLRMHQELYAETSIEISFMHLRYQFNLTNLLVTKVFNSSVLR